MKGNKTKSSFRKHSLQQVQFYGIVTILGLAPYLGPAVANADFQTLNPRTRTYKVSVGGVVYLCRNPKEARMQSINPDYLVPGCRLEARFGRPVGQESG